MNRAWSVKNNIKRVSKKKYKLGVVKPKAAPRGQLIIRRRAAFVVFFRCQLVELHLQVLAILLEIVAHKVDSSGTKTDAVKSVLKELVDQHLKDHRDA